MFGVTGYPPHSPLMFEGRRMSRGTALPIGSSNVLICLKLGRSGGAKEATSLISGLLQLFLR